MSAIITDQLRILNAKNFIADIESANNSFYAFIGLPNATEISSYWDISPPSPKDNFDEENNYWDTIIALKKIVPDNVRQVIRKINWTSGSIYDMYRHDISRNKLSKPSGATSLYSSNFYVVNSDYRVYICLHNGTDPENPTGRPSLDEPTFTDLEPKPAGASGDGYIWKYLYTIKPGDLIKFDSTNFMPVPKNWGSTTEDSIVKINSQSSGQLKIATITNRGSGVGPANTVYTKVPIKGDGVGAEATIVINNDSKVESITISKGGSGYTYGTVDLSAGNVPSGTITPSFNVIIPPKGGHGYDIYRELGAYNVLIYARIENDNQNPDFITGNKIARVGIVKNPEFYGSSSVLTYDKASVVGALKLTGIDNVSDYQKASFNYNSYVKQTIGTGTTVTARVVSYDQNTGVLKYWQDRTVVGFNTDGSINPSPTYGSEFNLNSFTKNIKTGGSFQIVGENSILGIDTVFSGVSTTINNTKYYLGQNFDYGISNPEVKKYSGDVVYVDNRPSITRSLNQKEDIKVILQF
jgi:hypothetical protein